MTEININEFTERLVALLTEQGHFSTAQVTTPHTQRFVNMQLLPVDVVDGSISNCILNRIAGCIKGDLIESFFIEPKVCSLTVEMLQVRGDVVLQCIYSVAHDEI